MANKITIEISVDDKGTAVMKQFGQNAEEALKKPVVAAQNQASVVDQLKEHWIATSAAIVTAWTAANKALDVTMAAARYETLGVVMRVVGNNAGYTGEQMDLLAKGLEKSGISMSESRQSLTRMVQAQLDLEQSTKLARVAQDAAVIGNINSSEAFQRLVYGIQSAQVEMLRTIGINVNFEEAYKKAQVTLGKTRESFTETEKANIRMNVALEAGEKITGTYEEAMGTAGKQILSMTRHLEDLKVLSGLKWLPGLTEAVEIVTKAVVGFNDELGSEKSKQAANDWGVNLRIGIISVEAEFMRVAMLIDKIGGSMTSAQMLLYGPGAALGVESSKKRFEAAAQANIDLENRYMATDKALEALAIKQIALEQSLTAEGKAAAKATLDALEQKRIALRKTNDDIAQTVLTEKEQSAILKSITDQNTKLYQTETEMADHALRMRVLAGENELNYALGFIDKKEEALNKFYNAQAEAINKNVTNEIVKQAKLAELDADYDKQWQKYEDQRMEKDVQVNEFLMKGRQSYYTWERKQLDDQLDYIRTNGGLRRKIDADTWEAIRDYEYLTGQKMTDDQKENAQLELDEYADTFVGGAKKALLDLQRQETTWGKASYDIVKTFSQESNKALSSVFFDAYKGQLKSASDYFTEFTDSMAKSFFDTLSKMITEAAINEIVLFFKSSWTENGGNVLSIVSSVLGIASDIFSESGAGSSLVPNPGYAYGGYVKGYAYGGDSPANDTVLARLSPGEYVVPRSVMGAIATQGQHGDTMLAHINPAEAALLKALGGAGTINERTGLPQFFDFGSILNIGTGGVYGAISGDWGGTKDIWSFLNPGLVSAYKAYYSHDVWDLIDAVFDPVTGPGITNLLNGAGGAVNNVLPWVGELIEAIAPTVGAIVGGVVSYGNPAGMAGGAAAGSGFASKWNQETNKEALEKAAIVAAVTYVSQYAGQYAAGETGSQIAGKAATMATAYAAKYIINEALGSVLVSDKVAAGQLAVSYMGAQDNGLLTTLQQSMADLTGRKYAFPAKNGLDYVPYDDFYIRGHEGEAILDKQDADEWRNGKNGYGGNEVTYNFQFKFNGPVFDKDGFVRAIIPAFNKALKDRVH